MATIASPRPAPSSNHSEVSIPSNDGRLSPAAPTGLAVEQQQPRRSSATQKDYLQPRPQSEASTSGASSPQYHGSDHDSDAVAPLNGGAAAGAAKRPGISGRLSRMFSHRGDAPAATPGVASKETSYVTRSRAVSNVSDTAGSTVSENEHPHTGPANGGASNRTSPPNGEVRHAEGGAAAAAAPAAPPSVDRKMSTLGAFKKDEARDADASARRRFVLSADGTSHEHCLKADKRQETLSAMFKGIFKRADAAPAQDGEHGLSLMSTWVDQVRSEKDKTASDQRGGPNCAQTLVEKYGKCQEVVGRGAFGIVRISHKADASDPKKEKLYAVKEFRRRPSESPKKYNKRLTSEFCISSALRHPNVIHTLDLLQDAKGDFCEVMEYCSGGDLYTLVLAAVKLEVVEADCYFKQLMRGVEYIHEMGVAHRDLKPENLLLTSHGALKITDFGNGECFRMAWEKEPHMVAGLCGSAPYIAPEEYTDAEFDPRAIDVWACGVIYMAMRTGRHLWRLAKRDEDDFYDRYCEGRKGEEGYGPIESLHRGRCRNVIYSVLDPNPRRRITASQVLKSEWGRSIHLCKAGEEGF